MHELDDNVLLREYVERNSEAAFAALVSRHVDKVHSVALRHTRNPHAAEEITQAVFVILARKSGRLGRRVILSGWLYQTARLTALTYIRGEIRRARREQEAFMQTSPNENESEAWPQIAPFLDDAMAGLSAVDRQAVVLRYFDGKSLKEVGAVLGGSEDAAKMRVNRAVEKLRKFFSRRCMVLSAATLTGAISANSVQAAPAALAKIVTAAAITKGATASGPSLALVKGALKLMAWTKAKVVIGIGAALLLIGGTAIVTIETISIPTTVAQAGNPSGYPWQALAFSDHVDGTSSFNSDVLLGTKAPPLMDIQPTVARNGESTANSVSTSENDVKYCGFGCTVQSMLMAAYGFTMTAGRTVVATELPTNRYDYIDNLPQGAPQAFKHAIAKKFGITATIQAMETNVLLLQVKNSGAPGLRPGKPDSTNQNAESTGPYSGEYHRGGISFQNWLIYCESTLKIPVVDQTGLTGNYDVDLKWQWGRGQSETEAFKQAVLDQLGLELVPGREKIDILVIEKSTKTSLTSLQNAYETATGHFSETNPPPIRPGQVDFPKSSWAFAGYASPEAALQTYFWAINNSDTTNFEASMTPGALVDFTKTLQAAGETEDQLLRRLAPTLKKISGYRILKTNDSDGIDFQIALEGGVNESDNMTIKVAAGAEWKVDEIPPHFSEARPQPIMPKQVDCPKASWAFAGYASPEAALQTYFWALNRQDATDFEASMTPGALADFTNDLQAAGQTKGLFTESSPILEKVSGYRILEIQADAADEVDFRLVMQGAMIKSDEATNELTIKKIGAEWKVDESP